MTPPSQSLEPPHIPGRFTIIRPTSYGYQDDEECFKDSDDFMLGSEYLVAPTTQPGQVKRYVHLPKLPADKVWHDFASGECH